VIENMALAVVVAVGLFFISLGGVSLVTPPHASRFLLCFAGSAPKHYTELALRVLVGGAFVLAAPRVQFPGIFSSFGWVLMAPRRCFCSSLGAGIIGLPSEPCPRPSGSFRWSGWRPWHRVASSCGRCSSATPPDNSPKPTPLRGAA